MRLAFPVLAAALAFPVSIAWTQDRGAGDAAAFRAQFEIVRRELAAHGTITEYAPNMSGEIVSRRVTLQAGREACEWVLAIDDVTLKRRVSAPLYKSTQTLPLAEIDPGSLKAHPIRERQWCCARSADVAFAAAGGRQPFRTQAGDPGTSPSAFGSRSAMPGLRPGPPRRSARRCAIAGGPAPERIRLAAA